MDVSRILQNHGRSLSNRFSMIFNTDVATRHDTIKSTIDKRRSTLLTNGLVLSSLTLKKKSKNQEIFITSIDPAYRKDALQIPLLISKYNGSVKSKKTPNEIVVLILNLAILSPCLRDEIYMQLCNSTTSYTKESEGIKSWELFCICFSYFRASSKVENFLEGYLNQHMNSENQNTSLYADRCYQILETNLENDNLNKSSNSIIKITIENVITIRESIYYRPKFGIQLNVLIRNQRLKYPNIDIPYFIHIICNGIINNNGLYTEGIFRVPGDQEHVNILKSLIDKDMPINAIQDPNTYSSLLKLWFRSLPTALFPDSLYNKCLEFNEDLDRVNQIIDCLDKFSKALLIHMLKFIRLFLDPKSTEITKMNLSNLVMVWAPNFLRCPSNDPMQILLFNKRECDFLRFIIQHYPLEEEANSFELTL